MRLFITRRDTDTPNRGVCMASIAKYKERSHGNLLKHNNRTPGDGSQHSNEEIDDSRTQFNYHLKYGTVADINNRLSDVFILKRDRQVTLCEAVVTLPKDVKPEDERLFFRTVYDFYRKDFGDENIINAVVHKDEVTPHMHIDFIPAVKDKDNTFSYVRKGGYGKCLAQSLDNWRSEHPGELERLSCKDVINRPYLLQMHVRLSQYVTEHLGYTVSILNGATEKGNKSILTLKCESLQAEIERLEEQKHFLNEDIRLINELARQSGLRTDGLELMPLLQTIRDLKMQNEVMQDIIRRNGCAYTKQDIEKMQSGRAVLVAKSTNLNVCDTTLSHIDLEQNSMIVTETFFERPRPTPQEAFFKRNRELSELLAEVQRTQGTVLKRNAPVNNQTCFFVKADNEQQTLMRLLELEKLLHEEDLRGRKLYMSKLEYDTHDFARSILSGLDANVFYCVGTDEHQSEETRNLQLLK